MSSVQSVVKPALPLEPRLHAARPWAMLVWGLFVIVVVAWSSRAVLGFDFVSWDDEYNIVINPHLGPPTSDTLKWMFTDREYMRRYIPLGWLGFSVAYGASGLSPAAYHFGNLVLHVTNAFLLFVLISGLLRRGLDAAHHAAIPAAAAATALLWAIHPLRAETVGWSSGLLYTLATCFALVSVLTYCRALTTRSVFWSLAALLFYAASLLTYPITLGLLAVFLGLEIAEWIRAKRYLTASFPTLQIGRRLFPFALVFLAGVAITLLARVNASAFWGGAASLEEVGVFNRLIRGAYSIVHYLKVSLWPLDLTPVPSPLDGFSLVSLRALIGTVVIFALTWMCWRQWTRRPAVLLLWAIFLALLAPMLGFTERSYYPSDRYLYLPGMLASVALAFPLASFAARWSWRIGVPALGVVVTFVALYSDQLRIWRDSPSLFARAAARSSIVRLTSDVFQRWVSFHTARGDIPAAEAVLARADQQGLLPATRALITASISEARAELRAGTAPLLARLHTDLARNFAKQGRHHEAGQHFAAAVAVAPQIASLRYNHAMHSAAQGQPRHALEQLLAALSFPNHAISPTAQRQAWSLIAMAFAQSNEPTLARAAQTRATE